MDLLLAVKYLLNLQSHSDIINCMRLITFKHLAIIYLSTACLVLTQSILQTHFKGTQFIIGTVFLVFGIAILNPPILHALTRFMDTINSIKLPLQRNVFSKAQGERNRSETAIITANISDDGIFKWWLTHILLPNRYIDWLIVIVITIILVVFYLISFDRVLSGYRGMHVFFFWQ